MNERQALDLACEHGIVVSTDRTKKAVRYGKWFTTISFKVGPLTLKRIVGENGWQVSAGKERYAKGEAIERAVRAIIEARAAA